MDNAFVTVQGARPWKLWKAINGTKGNLSATALPEKFSELNIFVQFTERRTATMGISIPYIHLKDSPTWFSVSDVMFIGFRESNFYGGHADLMISKTQITVNNARVGHESMMTDANFTLYIYYR